MGSPCVPEEGELSNEGSDGGDLDDLFVVDSTPSEKHHSNVDVPVYEQKFFEVLKVQSKEDKQSKPKRPKPPQQSCWNCGGEHNLRECREKRNPNAIQRARFNFNQNQKSIKASRYHTDEEQKFSHLQAGKISKRLQKALGLQFNQLPRHIYRMRCLGYPPGWVEEAKVTHSGMSLFNSEGQEVADPGFEEGEIVAEGAKDKYDIKKIIEYPGFNCPCNPETIDETERLSSKPMAEKDSIKFMATMWQPKAVKAYKRRKMNSSDTSRTMNNSNNKTRSLLLLDDMELESDDELSDEEGEVREDDVGNSTTPLSIPSQDRKRCGSVSPVESKKPRMEDTSNHNEISQDTIAENGTAEDIANIAGSTPLKSTPSSLGMVKSVCLGTPVIVASPYTCLPSADKFAKNICDVINFENLPDSTGKYEKMSGLIKKVRSFVSKLNSEEDED